MTQSGAASTVRSSSSPSHPALAVLAAPDEVLLSRAGLSGRLGLPAFLALAEALSETLANLHASGVMLHQIRPSLIALQPETGAVHFLSGRALEESGAGYDPAAEALAAARFAAPEQTGRMNRIADARADLYALGAVLFELASGEPPFTDSDPVELAYAHLARLPRTLDTLAPWVPPRVAQLVDKLLSKEPDRRYQSAAGLLHDLRLLRAAEADGGALDSVTLFLRDRSAVPRPPRRLYGCDGARRAMLTALERAGDGGHETFFVSGDSGLGKTSLIAELAQPVSVSQGRLVTGRFEQFQQHQPLAGPIQCFRQLCMQLLGQSDADVEMWRRRMLDGLGNDIGALFEWIPELEMLVGAQERPTQLSGIESQFRLRSLLVDWVRLVASPERLLVIVLEDLHWADIASLELFAALREANDISGLLLVGSFRPSEAVAPHPLAMLLGSSAEQTVELHPLERQDSARLIGDMLAMNAADVEPLNEVIYATAAGNPHFTSERVFALHRDGFLRVDLQDDRWHWQLDQVRLQGVSNNVVDFTQERLSRLSAEVVGFLLDVAGLGASVTLDLLSRATGESYAALASRARAPMRQGILVTQDASRLEVAEPGATLSFAHARIHEAVVRLRGTDWWVERHLAIARSLAAGSLAGPASVFMAAEHYARSASRIDSEMERQAARELFRQAARQARSVGSFDQAERMLRAAIITFPAEAWTSDPAALWKDVVELHLASYCQSHYDEADKLYGWLKQRCASPVELLDATCIQVVSLSNRTRYADAITVANDLLLQLGFVLPLEATGEALGAELERFYGTFSEARLEAASLSPAADAGLSVATRLLSRLIPATFFVNPALACWMAVRTGRGWLEQGYQPEAVYPMGCVALATILLRGDFATGYVAALRALSTGERLEAGVETERARHVFSLFNSHWFNPLEFGLEQARRAHEGLRTAGEIEFACYTYFTSQAASLDIAEDLVGFEAEAATALGFATKTGNQHAIQSFVTFRQFARAMQGATGAACSFDDDGFRESKHLELVRGNPMAQAYFRIYRALAACAVGDDAALVLHAEQAAPLRAYITGFYPDALANVLQSLALLARARQEGCLSEASSGMLAENQRWLAGRAADAQVNFGHLFDWVEAERNEFAGDVSAAHRLFEQAMRKAKAHRRPFHHAAIAHAAGRCLLRGGLEQAGQLLLAQAASLYQAWGAAGVVRELKARHSFLAGSPLVREQATAQASLEEQTLLRATEFLASERSLSELVSRLRDVVSRLTGATAVSVVTLDEQDRWQLQGAQDADGREIELSLEAAVAAGRLPGSVVRLGLRREEIILSDDAAVDARFAADPYWKQFPTGLCSLLAIPVRTRSQLNAFVLLENGLYRGAFTHQHVGWLSLLCGQLATSIENGRVYRSLERKVVERTAELRAAHEQLLENERERVMQAERERSLHERAYFDALTKLPNRALAQERLNRALDAARESQSPLGVLVVDIHQLKHVNDLYGHEVGDRLLVQVARRLERSLPKADTVARLGSDEFLILLSGAQSDRAEGVMQELCERLLALLSEPFDVDGIRIEIVGSVGVACFPEDGDTGETLIRNADIAGRSAKQSGSQHHAFFEPRMTDRLMQNLQVLSELRVAVANRDFELHYQPQIRLNTGEVVGVEALVRWRRDGKLVSPAAFIQVAEESGLILQIGRWVLEEACRQAAIWRKTLSHPVSMAVNLSAVQFKHPRFAEDVLAVVDASGIDPSALELELTESLLIDGEATVLEALALWKARGIKLSIDDFGTGYSGLSYLKRFDVDKIKLDRSFVSNVESNAVDGAIVRAILQMTRALNLRTVAEGVEEARLAEVLLQMGCDDAQGYYYARPLPAKELEDWCSNFCAAHRATG